MTANADQNGGPAYGRAFADWRGACTDDWRAYTRHGFVQGLGDGSLPRAAFIHYLRQDYVFLHHFARAWALGIVKSADIHEMQACTATVNALVQDEIRLHVEVCAKAGIGLDELEATAEAPANMAYTRYVLESGYSGDFLDLMAALAPCVLGYGEIGARLAAGDPAPDYAEWIGTYASAEYQGLCHDVGALIDRAVKIRLGDEPAATPRWQALQHRFKTATRLEVAFWDMGLRPE
ncbi:thiaminase II [Brevirhabdus pacifica]|uniref:Aminopyrimidine aminohydrolase n=1 Tax=Brevirhabdus pacifica TaxID=1267768 RepID=A0A1U7DL84_9RHOB|nr:thiaminase II [Brevirhabdus pacifica]APX90766.1 thiaminase II [Brevirhabdus pacifica]OWU79553.1 hypothetical protein ATO5_00160 [Loktanella sp. 22II-4b]PJJ87356.1 thiaminase/transcriptional activator TenA [Brevirhabdus pacifica]